MKRSARYLLIEILWLGLAIMVTLIVCRWLFQWDFTNSTLDIHLHDTYYVFSAWYILVPASLMVIFLLYVSKEIWFRFRRTYPNLIILISGLTLIGILSVFIPQLAFMASESGWTVYPPLSKLSESMPTKEPVNPALQVLINAITILQLLITVLLLFVCFRWGSQRRPGVRN